MSDAETTIKFAILDGYTRATGKPDEAKARTEAIFRSLFRPAYRWAIEEYLKEIAK